MLQYLPFACGELNAGHAVHESKWWMLIFENKVRECVNKNWNHNYFNFSRIFHRSDTSILVHSSEFQFHGKHFLRILGLEILRFGTFFFSVIDSRTFWQTTVSFISKGVYCTCVNSSRFIGTHTSASINSAFFLNIVTLFGMIEQMLLSSWWILWRF